MRQRIKTKNGKVLMTASLLLLDQLAIVGEELQVLQVVLLVIVSFDCNSTTFMSRVLSLQLEDGGVIYFFLSIFIK